MPIPAATLALLVGIAGWYYLFYSKAAQRLEPLEDAVTHRRRLLLRRINSVMLLLLAVGFYAGFVVESAVHPLFFLLIWLTVGALVIVAVLLAVMDLRLTSRIRKKP